MANPLLEPFNSNHVPDDLKPVTDEFCALAQLLDDELPDCQAKHECLHLLADALGYAKDALSTPEPPKAA